MKEYIVKQIESLEDIEQLPICVKAIELIRCENCSCFDSDNYCNKHGIIVHGDDYCSFAENKEE